MIPGAILANKYDLRLILILGWALSIPVPILYYYSGTWTDVIPGLIILQASGFNIPAFNAYVAAVSDKGKTGSNFGVVWASAPLGAVFSPAIGGLLLSWISIREIFLLSFVLFTVSTLVLFGMRRQPPSNRETGRFRLEVPRSTLEAILLLFLTVAGIGFSMATQFLPLFFKDIVSLNQTTIQLLGSIQALGQTAFAILLGRRADLRSKGSVMAMGMIVSATGLAGILLTRNVFLAFPLIFFFGGTRASSYVVYSVLSFIRSGATRAGQYGFYLTFENLGFAGGSYLGGVLYNINPFAGLLASVYMFAILASLIMGKSIKNPEA